MYPLVTELADVGIPVMVRCRVLKLYCQLYYRWLAVLIMPGEIVEAYRANVLFDAHRDEPVCMTVDPTSLCVVRCASG